MELRLFDMGSLEEELMKGVRDELSADENLRQAYDESANPASSYEMLLDELASTVAHEIAEEVVRLSDGSAEALASCALDGLGSEVAAQPHGQIGKANALPDWAKPQHRFATGLSNYVITAWPNFDRVLVSAARSAVKDLCSDGATWLSGAVGVGVATVAGPIAGVAAAWASKYLFAAVAETVASLATIAFSLESVDPALRCVYHRALTMSRLNHHAVVGDPAQVTVQEVVATFPEVDGASPVPCDELYLEKVLDCPFVRPCEEGSDASEAGMGVRSGPTCMLADKGERTRQWKDDEELEVKVRRMMNGLKTMGIFNNRMERHADRFYRPKSVVTGSDTVGGR